MKRILLFLILLIGIISFTGISSPLSAKATKGDSVPPSPSAKFKVAPNPGTDFMTIKPPGSVQFVYTICDAAGEPINQKYVPMYGNTIDLTMLAPGMYFIQFFDRKTGEQYGVEKIIKRRQR